MGGQHSAERPCRKTSIFFSFEDHGRPDMRSCPGSHCASLSCERCSTFRAEERLRREREAEEQRRHERAERRRREYEAAERAREAEELRRRREREAECKFADERRRVALTAEIARRRAEREEAMKKMTKFTNEWGHALRELGAAAGRMGRSSWAEHLSGGIVDRFEGETVEDSAVSFRTFLPDDDAAKAAILLRASATRSAEKTTKPAVLISADPKLEEIRHQAVVALDGSIPVQFFRDESDEMVQVDVPIKDSIGFVLQDIGQQLGFDSAEPIHIQSGSQKLCCIELSDSFIVRLLQCSLTVTTYRLPLAVSVLPGETNLRSDLPDAVGVVEKFSHHTGLRLEAILPHFEGHVAPNRVWYSLPTFSTSRTDFLPGQESFLKQGPCEIHVPDDAFLDNVQIEFGFLEDSTCSSHHMPFSVQVEPTTEAMAKYEDKLAKYTNHLQTSEEDDNFGKSAPVAPHMLQSSLCVMVPVDHADDAQYELFQYNSCLGAWFAFPENKIEMSSDMLPCLKASICKLGVFSIQRREPFLGQYIDSNLLNKDHNRTWDESDISPCGYWIRGGLPYVCPIGWTRVALSTPTFPEKWAVAFHGTKPELLNSILRDSLLRPGDRPTAAGASVLRPPQGHIARGTEVFGESDFTEHLFCSPCWEYAAHHAYARPFKYNGKSYQVMLQLRVNPEAIKTNQETVGASCSGRKFSPVYPNEEIEWRIKDPKNVCVYALCFRELPESS